MTKEEHTARLAATVERLALRVGRLESALRQIQRWDMLNPPYPGVLGDAPWLKKLVDDALATEEGGGDG